MKKPPFSEVTSEMNALCEAKVLDQNPYKNACSKLVEKSLAFLGSLTKLLAN